MAIYYINNIYVRDVALEFDKCGSALYHVYKFDFSIFY